MPQTHNLTLNTADLLATLGIAKPLCHSKTSLSYTGYLHLSYSDKALHIRATDAEHFYQGHLIADSLSSPFKLLLPFDRLLPIINAAPSEHISMEEMDDGWIRIVSGPATYSLVTMPRSAADDFPALETPEEAEYFSVDGDQMRRALAVACSIAPPQSDSRAHVQAALFRMETGIQGPQLVVCTTDSSRLSQVRVNLPGTDVLPPDLPESSMPGKRGLQAAANFLRGALTVRVAISKSRVYFRRGDDVFSVRTLEGSFPDTNSLIQDAISRPGAQIPLEALQAAIKRQAIITSDSYRSIQVSTDADGLTISANNPDVGESKETLPVEPEALATLQAAMGEQPAALNPHYLLDALEWITTENVRVVAGGEKKPWMFSASEARHYVSVIMPMRL